MSQQSPYSSPVEEPRRSSFASEKTLVETPYRDNSEKNNNGRKSSTGTYSSQSSGSSSSGIMDKAVQKIKSKLKDRDSTPKPKRRPVRSSYPDTAYMWRALAESKI
ncbi:uncharacterized protein F4822DRAFT_413757 [Hypoxylon trugodes]|uniref:uncharacterized protein n=1 Tax=Hypoxylon trugodes TaxID=326681 RepID=UPI00219A731C|nr:uncharacterized protein F4822DRAFT_413757 [Hypoxylon trugodes]KAI1385628.1 hypothetical protein F4822DRAFT_413757 [Hypoxylon trugodes]